MTLFLVMLNAMLNLIPNGNFEQGEKFWDLTRAEIVKGEGRNGTTSARIKLEDARRVDFSKTKFYVVSESFEVDPRETYTIVVWWRNRGKALFWVHCWCYDGKGHYVGDLQEGQIREGHLLVGPADFWHRRISFAKFPPETKTARLCLELIDGAGEVWFDDVAIFKGKVEDRALKDRPRVEIRGPKNVWLGEEVTFKASVSLPEGRRLVGVKWEEPSWTIIQGRKVPYGWRVQKEEERRLSLRPEHVGKFAIGAIALDSLGVESETVEVNFEVLPNEPPVAKFSWRVLPDRRVELDGSKSLDPDGKVASFLWEFPDGSVLQGRKVRHRLGNFGVERARLLAYAVRLIVKDEHGLENCCSEEVVFSLPPKRGNEEPTLRGEIVVEVDNGGLKLRKAPQECAIRLGFREYLPVKVVNLLSRSCEVKVDLLKSEPNVFVRGFRTKVVREGERMLEIQSFLFCDTEVTVRLTADGRSLDIPLQLKVKESMPLFGTQEHFTRTPPGGKALEDMAYLKFLPCQLYRLPDMLTGMAKPDRDWGNADWYIENLLKIGRTKALPFLGYIPTEVWVGLREGKTKEWEESVRLIVRRFRERVDYWESYNEPPWNEEVERWEEEEIAAALWNLMETFYRVVKEEDPKGRVVMPGWYLFPKMRRVVEILFERGVHRIVDIFNFHDYTCNASLPLTPDSAPEWRRFDERCIGLTKWMLELMRKYGGAEKPLWNTECGGGARIDERSKAMQWLRFAALSLSLGVKGLFQYEFYDYPHDIHPPTFYLMRNWGHRRSPLFYAFHEIILALTGAEPLGRVDVGFNDVTALSFERGNERILCLWSNAPGRRKVQIEVDKEALVEVVDISFCPQGPFLRKKKWLSAGGRVDISLEPLEFRILEFVNLR